jgi:hypothetical protein
LRASSTNQLLIPSSTIIDSQQNDSYVHPIQRTTIGRMDASTDEEERYLDLFNNDCLFFNILFSDTEEQRRKHRESPHNSLVKNVKTDNYIVFIHITSDF